MGYREEVLADAPYVYFTWDDNTWANLGSNAGAGTVGATAPVTGQATLAGLPNNGAALFSGGANGMISKGSMNSGTTWTFETWYKKDATNSATAATRTLMRMGTSSTYWSITLNSSTGYFRVFDSDGAPNDGITNATIVNGQWHHLAVTQDNGTITMYLDGASIGTISGSMASASAKTAWFGGESTANTGIGGYMDETAFYTTALSATRIAAHRTAGLTAPGISVSAQAPAIAVNIAPATAPVIKTTTVINKNIVAPVTTVTITPATAPIIKAVDGTKAVLAPTADYYANQVGAAGGTATTATLENSYPTLFKFTLPAPPSGWVVQSATLTLNRTVANSVINNVNYWTKVTDYAWSEASTGRMFSPSTANADSGVVTIPASGTFTLDVTNAVKGDQGNGFALLTDPNFVTVGLKENSTPANRPSLLVQYAPVPVVTTTVVAPVITVGVTMPQHRAGSGTKITVLGAGSVTVNAVNPTVTRTRNISAQSPAITLTQLFKGGRSVTPDVNAKATVMGDYYISTPNAKQYIAVPSINSVPTIQIGSIDGTSDNKVSLQTSRTVRATPMSVTLKLVGVYNREADRYVTLVGQTVDVDDTWLPLDDTSGTTARDIADYPANLNVDRNATNPAITYMGGPQLNVDGPHLRKAVKFDGVDDYIYLQYPAPITRTMNKVSFEFSIRTTQMNGTILTGGGLRAHILSTDPTGLSNFNADNQPQIRLVDGKIAIYGGLANYTTNGFVADGEWHHVVVSIPYLTNRGNLSPYVGDTQPTFVMVDGQIKWARYGPVIAAFFPSAAMAAVNYDVNGTPTVTRAIAGEMSHLIIRTSPDLGQALPETLARKLYYEWSDTILVRPEPMTVNLSMPAPHRARGNRKRMIVLFGLSNGEWPTAAGGQGFWEENNYFSIFANYYVGFEDMPGYIRTGTNGSIQNRYSAVAPFVLDEYICYPVALYSQQSINGAIQLSAEGMEKDGIRDPITRELIDNETGMLRFINLQDDLREPIENYDAITAINYPAQEPDFDGTTGLAINGGNRTGLFYEPKQWTKLSTIQWQNGRDKLRDSILEAAYDGVNLWINEPQMAQHLGFIQAWDKHDTAGDISKQVPIYAPALNYGGATGGNPNDIYSNIRGEVVDRAHMMPGMEGNAYKAGRENGRFFFTWQVNAKRVITSLEPGLTDLPGADIVEQIDYAATDKWVPHNRVTAYEVSRRPDGLHLGDSLVLPMDVDPASNFQAWSVGVPRRFIVSARPEGIAGKVISKEMDVYYGLYGVAVNNPFAGNVYTIAAERGTVVRGRPIKGRAFIEFMGADTQWKEIAVDRDKSKWHGETGKNVSNWDFDTRRYTELIASQLVNFTNRSITVGSGGSTTIKESSGSTLVQWYEREDRDFIMMPHTSMNSRGLHWLSLTDSIPAGTVRAFAGAMEVTIAAPAPKVTRTGGAVNTVVGPMRVDIDLRQPKNYRGADVREHVLPMTIGITMVGTGKVIKANPITLNITMPGAARVEGTGDRIFVYMDAGTEVTLFMKED